MTRTAIYNLASQLSYDEATVTKRGEYEAAISQKLTEEFAKQGAELGKFSLLDVRGE
jgi:hypothetical protein